MNQVKLIGRLTRDPELNDRGEKKVCDMRLAVNGPGNTPPLFIDAVAFGDLAESSSELEKGSEVEVTGALRYSEWEAKSSPSSKKTQKRSKHSVIVRELSAA
jgi:single-stranded DNA-binding protein